MKDKLIELVGTELDNLQVIISDVRLEHENNQTYLRVVLDSDAVIDLVKVVEATKVINPVLDKSNFIPDTYILDVYAKEKGDVCCEQ
ncbi:MAG: hypothetical protein RR047_02850 [Bacilli bacterium]